MRGFLIRCIDFALEVNVSSLAAQQTFVRLPALYGFDKDSRIGARMLV